jgi:hypothetical protein
MKPVSRVLTALLLAAPASFYAASLEIVREGLAVNLVHSELGHVYGHKQGALKVRDTRKTLALNAKLGAEFAVKARMRIDHGKMSAAAVVLDDRDFFLFGGSAGKMKLQRRDLTRFPSQDDGKSRSGGLLLDERVGCSCPDGQQTADGTIRCI